MSAVIVEAASGTSTRMVFAVLGVVLISSMTGCSARQCDEASGGDCVSLFDFKDRKYFMAPTQVVESVRVGREVGTGSVDPCPGDDPACVKPTDRQVFAFPGVPPTQAIVLTNTAGDGFAYIVTAKPPEGWDTGLTDYMERAGVRMPKRT